MSGKIVYSDHYNISFYGLEKLHKFPTDKYFNIYKLLRNSGKFTDKDFCSPTLDEKKIFSYLTPEYAKKCRKSSWISSCIGFPFLAYIPSFLLKKHLCRPMMWATCGTTKAAFLAMEYGKAVNLSGGYHHASFCNGEGFCIYPDIPIAIKELRREKKCQKIAVVDLDAHQGNGTERSFLENDPDILIIDVYNANLIFPNDQEARKAINVEIRLDDIADKEYLQTVEEKVFPPLLDFSPEIIIYNAGTDIYERDPVATFEVSRKGILARDKMLFKFAQQNNIPIAMTLSGGYHPNSTEIVAQSVMENLGE